MFHRIWRFNKLLFWSTSNELGPTEWKPTIKSVINHILNLKYFNLGGRLTLGILWPLGTLRLSEKKETFHSPEQDQKHHAPRKRTWICFVFTSLTLRSTLVHIFAFTEKYKSCHLLLWKPLGAKTNWQAWNKRARSQHPHWGSLSL